MYFCPKLKNSMKKIAFLVSIIILFCSCELTNEYLVNKNKCNDCGKCYKECPNDMIVREINYIDGPDTFYVARIRTNRCVGCGECQEACIENNGIENNAIIEK
jgi:ferredoxin